MKKIFSLGLGVLALAIPVLASAQCPDSLTVFQGHFSVGGSQHPTSAPGVFTANEPFTARVILDDTQQDPWYPFISDRQYTAVLTAEVLFYLGGFSQAVSFKPLGRVEIWEDTAFNADFGVPSTFTNGTLILTAQVNNMAGTRMNITGLPWTFNGDIVFDGGEGLANLLGCEDGLSMVDVVAWQNPSGGPLLDIPAGYKESYDADWICCDETLISVENNTWGGVKGLYR